MEDMESRIQTLVKDAWEKYWSLKMKYKALDECLACFPPKRHYRPVAIGQVWRTD